MEQRAVMVEPILDERLIEACQAGDRDAFHLLFEKYKDRVFSIAVYSSGGDETAAHDVSQQIFLKLMTSISQFRGDSAFTTWLYRLVVNAQFYRPARTNPATDQSQSIESHLQVRCEDTVGLD